MGALLILTANPFLGFAETPTIEVSEARYYQLFFGELKEIKGFWDADIYFESDNSKLVGLNEKHLSNFVRLRFKNNFSDMKLLKSQVGLTHDKVIKQYGEKGLGFIRFRLLTVGESYPVTLHLEIEVTDHTFSGIYNRLYSRSFLSYGSNDNIENRIKEAITNMMETLAIGFYKVRGDL